MKNALHRAVHVVIFLATRGLVFKDSEEKIGSQTNGNFLGIIKLISQYDPLLVRKFKLRENFLLIYDTVSALFDGYSHIKSALFQVAENMEQKIETRATAKGFSNKINNLASTVLLCFWKTTLERFNKNQFKLQRSDIILSSICEVYSSLKVYIMSKRGTFEAFEKKKLSHYMEMKTI